MVLVDVDIQSGVDDGYAYLSLINTYSAVSNYTVYPTETRMTVYNDDGTDSNQIVNWGWLKFTGITVPQGATINDATLTLQMRLFGQSVQDFHLTLFQNNSPITATTSQTFVDYLGLTTNIGQQSDFTISQTTVPFVQNTFDVKTIVQELVDNFDFNNQAMMFRMQGHKEIAGTGIVVKAFESGGSDIPNLTFNYTVGAPLTKDFTIDALIQALGVNGSCTEVDVDPSPLLDSIDLATTDVALANNQKIGQRVTFTSEQVAQIDQGIKTLRVWFSGPSGSKLEFEIYSDATVGQGSETLVADGGGITFVGGTAMSKKEKDFFDVPITMLDPFKPTAGVEYVIGVFTSISTGTTRKASGGDVIQGVLTGRTSGGNWTDVAGEDFSLQLVTVTTEGQHSCFEIDAQLIVAIPAQPFCINAILSASIDVMCTEFTIDAKLTFVQTFNFSIDAILGNKIVVTQVCLEKPESQFTLILFPGQSRIGECIQIVLDENPPSLTGREIISEINIKTLADPSFGFFGKTSRVKNWLKFLIRLNIIEEDGSDPDWYETNWSLV